MGFFKRLIDFFTQSSERPMQRLAAYYIVLAVATAILVYSFPVLDQMFTGQRSEALATAPQLLQNGLGADQAQAPEAVLSARLDLAISTTLICVATLLLMLPVSWVYMAARRTPGHSQSVVQTLIILPIIVAGIILIVRNSLALAFSLAGVVSVLRFRTTLSDARDIVFIFLGVAVGFAAGVQLLLVAVLLSVIVNFVLLLVWRYDFGRSVLAPTAGCQWAEPLNELAQRRHGGTVPDRDLVLALTPRKVEILTERFKRVGGYLGTDASKPRFNGILTITTNGLADTQLLVELALGRIVKRWKLDEVVTNEGKPSELYYLVKVRKSSSKDEVLTALRTGAGGRIVTATLEIGDAVQREAAEKKTAAKAGANGASA